MFFNNYKKLKVLSKFIIYTILTYQRICEKNFEKVIEVFFIKKLFCLNKVCKLLYFRIISRALYAITNNSA